jgi:MoaA/NifB/PqqE/SkfB family radical SAM enzyme
MGVGAQEWSVPSTRCPTVSVVIPSYRSRHLDRVFEGLVGLDAHEIIVVDSSPTAPVIQRAEVTLLHQPSQTGPSAARNIGAAAATGEYLLFVDSDILFTERTHAFLQRWLRDPQPGVITCGRYAADHGENLVSLFQNRYADFRYRLEQRAGASHGGSSHLLIRRSDFVRMGGFNQSVHVYEDIEFVARARAFGIHTRVDRDFVAVHLKRDSFSSLMRDDGKKAFNAFLVRHRDPKVFEGMGYNIGWAGHSWLASAALPLVAASALVLPWWASAVGLLALLAFISAVVWLHVFPTYGLAFRAAAVPVWIGRGIVITSAGVAALLTLWSRRLGGLLIELLDFARCGWRVVARSGWPVQLILFVTNRCSLRCGHCFYLEQIERGVVDEPSLDTVRELTQELGPLLWLSVGGGEPFLRDDLPELVGWVQRHCRPKVLTIPTNAHDTERVFEATQRMAQATTRGSLVVSISIDGPGPVHDALRGKGTHARAMRTIERLQPLLRSYPRLQLAVILTVSEHNAAEAPDYVEQIVESIHPGIVAINLDRRPPDGASRLPEPVLEAYEQANQRYLDLMSQGSVQRLRVPFSGLLREKERLQRESILRIARDGTYLAPCMAGTLGYVVYPDGALAPCEVLDDTLGKLGEAGGPSFGQLARGQAAKDLRHRIRQGRCQCTFECAMSTNVLFSWPLATRLWLRWLRGPAAR